MAYNDEVQARRFLAPPFFNVNVGLPSGGVAGDVLVRAPNESPYAVQWAAFQDFVGAQGRSISTVTVNPDNSLTITYSDASTEDTDPLATVQGEKGDQGDKGDKGDQGEQGWGLPLGGAEGQVLAKDSSDDGDYRWQTPIEAYDVTVSTPELPADGAKLVNFQPNIALTLPEDLAGSVLVADVAATAEAVFSIRKNDVEVATITVAAASSVGTMSTQAAVSFAATDKLSIIAPATADTTLAAVGITLHLEIS